MSRMRWMAMLGVAVMASSCSTMRPEKVSPLRVGVILLAVVLSALVSAEVGLVGFVGLAAPAIARALGARTMRARLLLAPVDRAFLRPCGSATRFGLLWIAAPLRASL